MKQYAQDQLDNIRVAIAANDEDQDEEVEDDCQGQRETSGPNALGDGHIKLGSAQECQTLHGLMQAHQIPNSDAPTIHSYFKNLHTRLSSFFTQLLRHLGLQSSAPESNTQTVTLGLEFQVSMLV